MTSKNKTLFHKANEAMSKPALLQHGGHPPDISKAGPQITDEGKKVIPTLKAE